MSDSKYWCYIEKGEGKFAKVAMDIGKPVPHGYFVAAGVAAGDQVVTTAAGQLLAKEINSDAEPD